MSIYISEEEHLIQLLSLSFLVLLLQRVHILPQNRHFLDHDIRSQLNIREICNAIQMPLVVWCLHLTEQ